MTEIRALSFAPGYGVDAEGNVYTKLRRGPCSSKFRKEWLPMAPQRSTRGYLNVALMVSGRRQLVGIHRLVVHAFIGEIPNGMQVNHLDGVKTNNRVENLEITTPAGNIAHGIATGLIKRSGTDSVKAKLTTEQAQQIREAWKNGAKQRDIATQFNVSQSTVWRTIHDFTRI